MPSVSPDGRQVVFSSERDSVWELYSVRPDGSGLRRLTHTPEEELVPGWTHDGRLVAMSDAFEWCADCDRDFWRGKPWDGVTTPEGSMR